MIDVATIATTRRPQVRRIRSRLTMLSFGGGQDSTALLYKLVFDSKFRQSYAPHDLLVVMSDTGDEHPRTYLHVRFVQKFCEEHGVEFVFLSPSMGFHSEKWRSLRFFYRRSKTVGSKAFVKSCTDQLKVQPIYRFLNKWVSDRYGHHQYGSVFKGKNALVCESEEYGKIRVLLGIGSDETTRVNTNTDSLPKWMRLSIHREYPLVDLGWGRTECQDYVRSLGLPVPWPSNCMLCPFLDKIELLWLAKKYPDDFAEWVAFERAKFKKFAHKGDKNVGVWGNRKALTTILQEAEAEFGHWTLADLEDHKFSHGHCVMSKY